MGSKIRQVLPRLYALLFCIPLNLALGKECTTDGDVRLVPSNGWSRNEGRVEVCLSGEWGTICNKGWGMMDAVVVCRQLGLVSSTTYADVSYEEEPGSGPIHFSGVQCSGNETHILNCSVEHHMDSNCNHNQDVAVQCLTSPCRENDVRINGVFIEVCHDQKWGLVCVSESSYNYNAAELVCHQVGFPTERARPVGTERPKFDIPVILNDVWCTGSEDSLRECSQSGYGIYNDCSRVAISQCEMIQPCSNPNSVQLRPSGNDDSGRLEVCSGGRWGSVCAIGIRDTIASVICRQLNYADKGTVLMEREIGATNHLVPITQTNITCRGLESTIADCSFQELDKEVGCSHDTDLFINCAARKCREAKVRLVNGQSPYDGRVEVCIDGLWGTVCDNEWDSRDATVVCRQLHYNGPSYALHGHSKRLGRLKSYRMADVQCSGNETNLVDCSYKRPRIGHCQSEWDRAGVICTDMECEDGTIHLVGGDHISRGRVEFCYDGRWYSICATDWGAEQTRVVCKTLRGYGPPYVTADFGRGLSPILPFTIHCNSHDTALKDCTKVPVNVSYCSHAAAVMCRASCFREGFSECGDCEEGENCQVGSCSCHSDCYEYGNCCPDVPYMQNCTDDECESGSVRLVGGSNNSTGVLEVCANGVWGKVCNSNQRWGPANTKVVCQQLGYPVGGTYSVTNQGLLKSTNPRFVVGEVHCVGTETELLQCSHSSVGNHQCGKLQSTIPEGVVISCYDIDKCNKELSTSLEYPGDINRYGECEAYIIETEVCVGILRTGIDYVFINHHLGTQTDIGSVLDQSIKLAKNVITSEDVACLKQVSRILCHYYLPTCGNTTDTVLPSLLCQEECVFVRSTCQRVWELVESSFNNSYHFINCKNTSQTLFPQQVCCYEVDIFNGSSSYYNGPVSSNVVPLWLLDKHQSTALAGTVGGTVTGLITLLIASSVVVSILSMYLYKRKKNFVWERITGASRSSRLITSGDIILEPMNTAYSRLKYKIQHESQLQKDSRTLIKPSHMQSLRAGRYLIKNKEITIIEKVGEGEFGIVYRARLNTKQVHKQGVAVKSLKGSMDGVYVHKFVEEALKMSRFKHSHVIELIGVCVDAQSSPLIVMPYMANGSLLHHLRKERDDIVLTSEHSEDEVVKVEKYLSGMCCQIASGMEYLVSQKVIHRDLAARNCMIDTHSLIKITDFGLSEDLFVKNYFRQGDESSVKLPVKWMAPESLGDGLFSEKSDVWSFGVTMWEIFSGGLSPFPGVSPHSLLARLMEGERMAKPYNAACSDEMYAVMMKCWEKGPHDRPTFHDAYRNITSHVEQLAGYLQLQPQTRQVVDKGLETELVNTTDNEST